MKHLSGAPLLYKLPALPTNIRQGWKELTADKQFNTNIGKLRLKKFDNIGPWLKEWCSTWAGPGLLTNIRLGWNCGLCSIWRRVNNEREKVLKQGMLTEGKGPVRLTSSYR